ncbi:hypothetical protein [Hydrogenophaga sp.]
MTIQTILFKTREKSQKLETRKPTRGLYDFGGLVTPQNRVDSVSG